MFELYCFGSELQHIRFEMKLTLRLKCWLSALILWCLHPRLINHSNACPLYTYPPRIKRSTSPTLFSRYRCEHPQTALKLKVSTLTLKSVSFQIRCVGIKPKQWETCHIADNTAPHYTCLPLPLHRFKKRSIAFTLKCITATPGHIHKR